jgi:hypothetical protein
MQAFLMFADARGTGVSARAISDFGRTPPQGFRNTTELALARPQEWPDMCCGSEPASDARGVSSKNIA